MWQVDGFKLYRKVITAPLGDLHQDIKNNLMDWECLYNPKVSILVTGYT